MAGKNNANEKPKNRMKNLDDLFDLNGGVNPIMTDVTVAERQPTNEKVITSLDIEKLTPFSKHPFKLYEGERLSDMVESIRSKGVLVPIIVRRLGEILEILSGHNRVEAAKLANLGKIPALILENVSDGDAMVYVVETNLMQRSFADMLHSEKAAVIALHHSKMFSQGKRNDILAQIKILEKPHEHEGKETSGQVDQKLYSREKVALEYNLASKTVARYLRVNQLISELKPLLDSGSLAFGSAVTLSFLNESEQKQLVNCIEKHNLSVDMKKADALRKHSEKNRLDNDSIFRILSGSMVHKPLRTPTIKVRKAVYAKYFKSDQSAKEVQEIVEKALDMYFEQEQIS